MNTPAPTLGTPVLATSEALIVTPPLWRSQLVYALEILGVIAMFLGGADWLNLINALPTGSAPAWALLVGGVVNKGAKPLIMFLGDWADDGKINKSFILESVGLWLMCGFSLCFASCAGTYAGLTGQPIPTTPVQRTDGTGKPFNVATTDVQRAESSPPTAWGLYNAGAVAARTAELVDAGK